MIPMVDDPHVAPDQFGDPQRRPKLRTVAVRSHRHVELIRRCARLLNVLVAYGHQACLGIRCVCPGVLQSHDPNR